jgi:opacity protein-like surface antigen
MNARTTLAAAFIGAFAAGAGWAQPVTGPYVSLGGGVNLLQDEKLNVSGQPAFVPDSRLHFDLGPAASGAVGYGFGNGFRLEVEGNWRQNDVESWNNPSPAFVHGRSENYGALANLIFDMDVGANWIYPYFGAGAGYSRTTWNQIYGEPNCFCGSSFAASGAEGHFAYQGLFGLSFPVAYLPGLSLTAEYRFFSATGSPTFPAYTVVGDTITGTRIGPNTDFNHTGLIGLRYELFPPPPPLPAAPVTAPAPAAVPAPEAARTYLVFFDWDRADLTSRARQIVAEAAQASTHVQTTRIEVNGYTDLSGSAAYNQRLSVRRAESVEAELVRDGVAQAEIAIQGFGESNPLVPTAQGVREPQNRRVEIILK